MEPIKIVLAEDQSLLREGTKRILHQYSDLRVIGEADDAKEALSLVKRLQPDVVLADARTASDKKIELIREIRHLSPGTRVLMVSALCDGPDATALMAAGASGCLGVTIDGGELVRAVRRAYEGEKVAPAAAMTGVPSWTANRTRNEKRSIEQLSPREREILSLAAGGMRNQAIADKLSISIRTVEGHFSRIFDKLGVSSRTEAVLCLLSRTMMKGMG